MTFTFRCRIANTVRIWFAAVFLVIPLVSAFNQPSILLSRFLYAKSSNAFSNKEHCVVLKTSKASGFVTFRKGRHLEPTSTFATRNPNTDVDGASTTLLSDEDAEILAWKRVERVLTEKAKAEARAKAEAKAKAAAKKNPRPILIWDIMSTICYDPFYVDVPAFLGMSLSELYKVKDKSSWEAFELGRLSEDEMLDNFFLDKRTFDKRGLVDTVTSRYAFLPGMERLLDILTGQGYPMHAMSNYPVWWRAVEDRLRLKRFLRWTFVSCEAGVRKPDPAAYRAVLERLNVPADRSARVPGALLGRRDLGRL